MLNELESSGQAVTYQYVLQFLTLEGKKNWPVLEAKLSNLLIFQVCTYLWNNKGNNRVELAMMILHNFFFPCKKQLTMRNSWPNILL